MQKAQDQTSAPGGRRRVYTIGHSTRAAGEFLDLLRAHGITRLADVRSAPRSRRHPQFDSEALGALLAGAGILYAHLPRLGGLRRPRPDSRHAGLRDEGLRGYADHMETAAFQEGVRDLLALATAPTAVMCAESSPRHCHRSLLSDALVALGVQVLHILDAAPPGEHRMSAGARLENGRVCYPPEQGSLFRV